MIRVEQLKLSLDGDEKQLAAMAARVLGISPEDIAHWHIRKKAVDARRKQNVHFVYSIDVCTQKDEDRILGRCRSKNVRKAADKIFELPLYKSGAAAPVVVGFGPAGMFAALALARMGMRPIVIERGRPAAERAKAVQSFWQGGAFCEESNVQFGEGGAGTFSDGKLTTGTKSPYISYIMKELADCGGGEDILYDAKPHIGTDRLLNVVAELRRRVIDAGGTVLFSHKLTDIVTEKGALRSLIVEHKGERKELPCSCCILALGHSAGDTLEMLLSRGMIMEPKAFAMGVRIEHKQEFINAAQYGPAAGHAALPAAEYKLVAHLPNGHTAYTFCMCPGGKVVAAASLPEGVVTNGMSYAARDGKNANSAVLVSLTPQQFPSLDTPLSGMYWQRQIEQKLFFAAGGGHIAPVQLTADLLADKATAVLGRVEPTYEPGVMPCSLSELLPAVITDSLKLGLAAMDRQIKGFAANDSLLTAAETRSSSPVRMVRDDNCCSSVSGLFCCGEGAGYAGGIISSAADGMRCALSAAEAIKKD